MDPVPPDVCHVCKRVADPDTKEIAHKQYCTVSLRNAIPRHLRSTNMSVAHSPPTTSSATTGTTTTDTVTSVSATTPTRMPTTTPPSQRRQLNPDEARQLQGKIEILEQALRAQKGLTDAAYGKAAEAADEKDLLDEDLQRITQERQLLIVEIDRLKASATTPRSPSPALNSVQAMLDANKEAQQAQLEAHKNDIKELCKAFKTAQASASPGTSSAKVNPAARHIECTVLEDPGHVTLHDYINWKHLFQLFSDANSIDKEPYTSRKAFVIQKLHRNWQPLILNGDIEWDDTQSLNDTLEAISKYIKDRRHALLDRRDFLRREQRSTETHEMFLQQLREHYNCSRYTEELTFPLSEQDFQRTLVRDLFLKGVTNNELRKEILKHPLSDLTLDKVTILARQLEQATATSDNLQGSKSGRVYTIGKSKSQYKRNQKSNAIQRSNLAGREDAPDPPAKATVQPKTGSSSPKPKMAFHRACMQTHAFGSGCHAANLPCEACGTLGHVPESPHCPKQKNNKSNIRTIRTIRTQRVLEHTDPTPSD